MGQGNNLFWEKWIFKIIQNTIGKWSIILDFFSPSGKIKTSIQWFAEGKANASTCNNGNVTKAKELKESVKDFI